MIGSPQTRLSVCLCMIAFSSRAAAFTVSGTIRDKLQPIGDVVANIKVRVMNAHTYPVSEIDAVYTNAAGFYSTNQATAGQSVYIIVVYEMPLTGPLASGTKAGPTRSGRDI